MELLVHIGAPSSRKNDDLFKAQLASYIHFIPSRTARIIGPKSNFQALEPQIGEASPSTQAITHVTFVGRNRVMDPGEKPRSTGQRQSKVTATAFTIREGGAGPRISMSSDASCSPGPPLDVMDKPNFRPPTCGSNCEKLDSLQTDWRKKHATAGRVPCVPLAMQVPPESGSYLDTQFAISALQSQLYSQPCDVQTQQKRSFNERIDPASKRRRVASEVQSHDALDTSLELCVPHVVEQPVGQASQDAMAETAYGPQQGQLDPRTPEPDSMNSLLPSDYGISDTTTDTSGMSSRHPANTSQADADVAGGQLRNTSSQEHDLLVHVDPSDDEGPQLGPSKSSASDAEQPDDPRVPVGRRRKEEGTLPRKPLQRIGHNAAPSHGLVPTSTVNPSQRVSDERGDFSVLPSLSPFARKTPEGIGISPMSSSSKQFGVPQTVPEGIQGIGPFAALPLEAHSPPPPIGSALAFDSQVTSKLRALMNMPALAMRYRVGRSSRAIQPSERGRWEFEVSCTHPANMLWPIGQQVQFWQLLCKLIADGSLGWGIWCVRKPSNARGGSVERDAKALQRDCAESIGLTRVFCWGEIVQHVWLLLYTLSNNKIRLFHAKWVDAKGESVVEMPIRS